MVDLDNIAPVVLLTHFEAHRRAVRTVRLRANGPSADAAFGHAVAALSVLHLLVDRLQALRWPIVRDALAADACRGAEVAVACGLDGAEVASGLQAWVERLHRAGLVGDVERGVVNLLVRSAGEAG